MPENGDSRLDQRLMKLLPNWNQVVRANPALVEDVSFPFQDKDLAKLLDKALEIDKSYNEIKETVKSLALQWPNSLKIK